MHVIKLCEGETKKPDEYHPGLPAVEFVMPVNDCANQQLNCRFCNQKRMCRQNSTDSSEGHSSVETHARSVLA